MLGEESLSILKKLVFDYMLKEDKERVMLLFKDIILKIVSKVFVTALRFLIIVLVLRGRIFKVYFGYSSFKLFVKDFVK